MTRAERLFDVLTGLDDDLIEEAAFFVPSVRPAPKRAWGRWAALAACLVLALGVWRITPMFMGMGSSEAPRDPGQAAPDGSDGAGNVIAAPGEAAPKPGESPTAPSDSSVGSTEYGDPLTSGVPMYFDSMEQLLEAVAEGIPDYGLGELAFCYEPVSLPGSGGLTGIEAAGNTLTFFYEKGAVFVWHRLADGEGALETRLAEGGMTRLADTDVWYRTADPAGGEYFWCEEGQLFTLFLPEELTEEGFVPTVRRAELNP